MLRIITILSAVMLSPLLSAASDAAIRAASAGFVYDAAARAIRPVTGITGASVLGSGVAMGTELRSVAIAPGSAFALVGTPDGPAVMRLGTASAGPQPIAGCTIPLETLVFSPAGTSAAAYQTDAGLLYTLTGLPEQPVCKAVSLAGSADEKFVLAVNDSGSLVLAGSDRRLILIGDSFRELPAALPVAAVAFRRGSDEAVVAGGGIVSLFRGLPAAPTAQVLLADTEATAAVGFGGDRVIAAGPQGNIVDMDPASGETRAAQCNCAVERLLALDSGSTFQLNTSSFAPLWVLESSPQSLRVWFVPPAGDEVVAKGESW